MAEVREAPLYQQVAERIRDELGPGLDTGSRLPSERVLCQRFDVSRVTLRSALHSLEQDGILTSAAARGWFVTSSLRQPRRSASPLMGFSDLAHSLGQATSARVLETTTRPSTIDESELLAIVPGAPVFVLRRLRCREGLIIALDRSCLPLSLCPGIAEHDFSHASLYAVLRAADPPVHPTVADYAVEAMVATTEEAELLELPPSVPLLVATQQTRDQQGRLCELGRTIYRGDRFRFRASLGERSGRDGVRTPRSD